MLNLQLKRSGVNFCLLYIALMMNSNSVAAGFDYSTANEYLNLWQSGDYSSMYSLLSDQSKAYITRGEFINEHRNFARKFIMQDFEITEITNSGQTACVYYRLYLTCVGSGESVIKSAKLILVKEDGIRKVACLWFKGLWMARCKYRNRSGLFLSLNSDGLCNLCALVIVKCVNRHVEVIENSWDIIERTKSHWTKIGRYNTIIRQWEYLQAMRI